MGKFFSQVILLTRKNIKVRFSHRFISFCELGIPLLITLVLGLPTTYFNGQSERPPLDNVYSGGGKNALVESKYDCVINETYQPPKAYNCERWYDPGDGDNKTAVVFENKHRRLDDLDTVLFLVADNLTQAPGVEELLETILKVVKEHAITKVTFYGTDDDDDSNTTSREGVLQWERSDKTEKELEICLAQHDPSCKSILAVVVITRWEEDVQRSKKVGMEYKLRMGGTFGLLFAESANERLFVDYSPEEAHYEQGTVQWFYFPSQLKWRLMPVGFIYIQKLVDQGIVEYINGRQSRSAPLDEVEISLVRMPFVLPKEHDVAVISQYLSLIYSLLASLSIFSLMRVNTEKSSGFKELLRMHGVTVGTQWTAWFLSNLVVYALWTLALSLAFWVPFLGGRNVLSQLNINCILYWLLLLLLMVALSSFSYLVSVFFERVWTAASIGLLVWILLTVVMMLVSTAFHTLPNWGRLGMMLFPAVAFDFCMRFSLNGGGTLTTFAVPVIENVPLTTFHGFVMLLLDSCIYMALAVYLDNVMPSKFGVRKSPWYVFRNLRHFIGKIRRGEESKYATATWEEESNRMLEMTAPISSGSSEYRQPFEADPKQGEAAVVLQKLRKTYRRSKLPAVDRLSAKMFTGEIYALLGFNGAGKTTTIGVLTGLSAPTDGFASIFDLDISKDMEEIRRHIGLCPQHNLLYDDLSVVDHVAFFGRLKGLPEPEEKAKELLTWMGMTEKLESTAEQLSGGQKRMVHLAIALIGDTKLAFLDEPTSGLDPESRRCVWDILLKLRGKMTIVLTTHDMEEADVLGDRIGIMSEGKMICSGTPSFLKKYYEVGYNLNMNIVPATCDVGEVYKFVRNYIPGAKMNSSEEHVEVSTEPVTSRTGRTLRISLPSAEINHDQLADLMEVLQQKKAVMGVDNIGLSMATMEEVFLKVGESVRAVDVNMSSSNPCATHSSGSRYEGRRLQWYRFSTLLLKRATYFCHAPFTMIFLILVFGGFLWLSIVATHKVFLVNFEADPPQLVSSLQIYPSPVVVLHDGHSSSGFDDGINSYGNSYKSVINRNPTQIQEFSNDQNIDDILTSLKISSIQDLLQYRRHYLTGASFNDSGHGTNITGFFSAYALHGAPLSLNLISQARIKKLFDVDADIAVVNHPLPRTQHMQYITPGNLKYERTEFNFKISGSVIVLVIISSLLTSTAAFLPTEERLNKGKQLQLMTGTTPFLYWMSLFSWDFAFFSLVNVIITLVYILAESGRVHAVFTGSGVIFLLLECHTFAALWFSYLLSWAPCIKTSSDGFLMVNKFAVIVGVLGNVLRSFLILVTVDQFRKDSPSTFALFLYYVGDLSGYILWLVPMHSLYQSVIKVATIGFENNICNIFPPEVLQLACATGEDFERSENETWFMHSCCENCKENCFQPRGYLSAESVNVLSKYEAHGIIFDLLAMFLAGVLSGGVLFFLEYRGSPWKGAWTRGSVPPKTDRTEGEATQEEDVKMEASLIDNIVKSKSQSASNLGFIGQDLTLNFDGVTAVKGLSFGVHPGECFGLLGVSGAGKSATFRMITGDVTPTRGDMFSGDLHYQEHRLPYLGSMGYCPQINGIIGGLTGLQMVKLYGALRGLPSERLTEEARIWLDKFGLLGSANKKCAAYSGGMKRRLSVAMALIGSPKLILLDEPTTGVDPAFRRQFWNVITELKGKGQSILMTSYTMDECEALCNRVGIMVNGQLKCLGNTCHLKSKFGKGYILTIKLAKVREDSGGEQETLVTLLQNKILEHFSPCQVQSQQKALIQYQILNKSLWYSDIFRGMEQIKVSCNLEQVIEEYSVTETTLEDVFISFAREQGKREDCVP